MPLTLLDLGYDILNYINDLKNESIFCDKYNIDCNNFIIKYILPNIIILKSFITIIFKIIL